MFGCCSRDKEKQKEPIHESKMPNYLEVLKYEEAVLKHSGLEIGREIIAYNVNLDDKGVEFIHCIECGFQHEEEEPILLIHGYGGSSLQYYRIFQPLAQKRRVYSICLSGMGLSSRNDFELSDPQEVLDYFISRIKLFLEKKNITKQVIIIGHSFGGYISAFFSLKYPELVKTLHLLSPVGTTKQSQQQVEQFEKKAQQDMGLLQTILYVFVLKRAWQNKATPTSFYNDYSLLPKRAMLSGYLENTLGYKGEELKDVLGYTDNLYKLKESSEKGFHCLFMFPNFMAHFPLEEHLINFKLHVHFYYGDQKDWMYRRGALKLINKGDIQGTFTEIKDGTHNMFVDHPELLSQQILKNQLFDDSPQSLVELSQKQSFISNDLLSNSGSQSIQ